MSGMSDERLRASMISIGERRSGAGRYRYEGRNEERGDSRRVERFLFIAPFSIAHLRRWEGRGIRLRVYLFPVSPSCWLSLSRICVVHIVSVPVGVGVSGVS